MFNDDAEFLLATYRSRSEEFRAEAAADRLARSAPKAPRRRWQRWQPVRWQRGRPG